jgi:hypothetical protein
MQTRLFSLFRWFKEGYRNDRLVADEVDPLKDSRITISGGQLIINNPNQVQKKCNNDP